MLELTETSLVDDLERCAETLGRLRALGARIAIDDFGSGYSSLNYVRSLPIDIVKIDRAFVTQIDTDERNRQIVEVITALAATLQLSTVAEGVESATEAAALRRLGCDLAQGYHLGRPMAAADIAEMLDRAARRAS